MSSTTHTDNRSRRHRTLVLVIGILVALVIGLSLSASAMGLDQGVTQMIQERTCTDISCLLKMGSAGVKTVIHYTSELSGSI